jgi:hypothetical protein
MHLWIPVLVLCMAAALWSSRNGWLYERRDRPFCHRVIDSAFRLWCIDQRTNAFPNVAGRSADSLAALRPQLQAPEVEQNYRYVPGLCDNDPGGLILMYYARPTRWTDHIEAPTIFTRKAWIIVPIDFIFMLRHPVRGPGEMSERVSTAEFRVALSNTLDFIRTNQRPNWETIVKEHEDFLRQLN